MKVTPKVTQKHKTVDYADLQDGECFIFNGELFAKGDIDGGQYGFCLSTGEDYIESMCGNDVIPVNAEVKWSYKDQKKKK